MNYTATSNQHHALAPLPLEKEPLVATVQEVGRTTEAGWMIWGKKNSLLLAWISNPDHAAYTLVTKTTLSQPPLPPPQEHVTGVKYVT
jgi:hypothetical protein